MLCNTLICNTFTPQIKGSFCSFKYDVPQPQFSRCVTTFLMCYNLSVECGTTSHWNVYNYTTTSTGMLLSKQKRPRCKIRGGQELKPFMSSATVNNLVSSVDDNKVLTSSIQSMDLY